MANQYNDDYLKKLKPKCYSRSYNDDEFTNAKFTRDYLVRQYRGTNITKTIYVLQIEFVGACSDPRMFSDMQEDGPFTDGIVYVAQYDIKNGIVPEVPIYLTFAFVIHEYREKRISIEELIEMFCYEHSNEELYNVQIYSELGNVAMNYYKWRFYEFDFGYTRDPRYRLSKTYEYKDSTFIYSEHELFASYGHF